MTQTTIEIRCPKCNSNQLSANKKGFSGKNAVIGGLLTGGIGVLAGTIGSNTVKITCLACGKEFKPGEGKAVTIPNYTQTPISQYTTGYNAIDYFDKKIIEWCSEGKRTYAYSMCQNMKKWNLQTSIEYVDKLAAQHGIPKKGGCFVATVCYGDYDAPEVLILRQFRDDKLLKTFIGKVFVKFYYSVSPFFATLISKSDLLKKMVRQYFLEPIVRLIQQQQGGDIFS